VQRGKDGIRQASQAPRRGAAGHWDSKTTIYEGDVLLLGWGAEGGGNRIEDGIDPSSSATA